MTGRIAYEINYMNGWDDAQLRFNEPWQIASSKRAKATDENLNVAYLDGWAAGRYKRNEARNFCRTMYPGGY